MTFEHIERECTFNGPALPEPFVKLSLADELKKRGLILPEMGDDAKARQARWDVFRRKLGKVPPHAGAIAVKQRVLEPLAALLGYARIERAEDVKTREGDEDGGWLLVGDDGSSRLRAWTVDRDTDLDAPKKRGHAFRFSHGKIAQRVLLEEKERVALLTDGTELRVLLCDPARPESQIVVRLDRSGGWAGQAAVPDSFRLVWALASVEGVPHVADLVEQARLGQTKVTAELRKQARRAVEGFVQAVLDHPDNIAKLQRALPLPLAGGGRGEGAAHTQPELAKELWREGLVLVYRLLFVFKLESSADRARAFSFASSPLWRQTYSPSVALARHVDRVKKGELTGRLLEDGLRTLFRLFARGLDSSELTIRPLGGMLFGEGATRLLDELAWGERAVAELLDQLLWTEGGKLGRQRVHYGPLDVEDLGRVYEALLELEPGIASEPMCRLRRDKLEVVVPAAQGEPYKSGDATKSKKGAAAKSKVEWVEDIAPGRFYLRVGLGRKSSGSYYTPHPFVRFLVQETLGPQIAEKSPESDPNPGAILELSVLDPAMGSGHFLVEACRFLGEHLYEACRLCDERATELQEQASSEHDPAKASALLARAETLLKRVVDLPDPDDELVAWLPSRTQEGAESLNQQQALALCRRLVAVHCLYGVDKNPLAVELAKLSLWLESYAEGLPLTFLDHRLIQGDSLTGPFLEQLWTYPGTGASIDELHRPRLRARLEERLADALRHVDALEKSVGIDHQDVQRKQSAKRELDAALAPFRTLSAAWTGGVMLGDECDDTGYEQLLVAIAEGRSVEEVVAARDKLARMVEIGGEGLPYDLVFPEVFHPDGKLERSGGFSAVVGNPPWEKPHDERIPLELDLLQAERTQLMLAYRRAVSPHYAWLESTTGVRAAGHVDLYVAFLARCAQLPSVGSTVGLVVGTGFAKNTAAQGARYLVCVTSAPRYLLHWDNQNQIFTDLPAILEFALVVFARGTPDPTTTVHIAEHLCRAEELDALSDRQAPVSAILLSARAGSQLTLSEIASFAPGAASSLRAGAGDAAEHENLSELVRELVGTLRQEQNSSAAWVAQADATSNADPRFDPSKSLLAGRGMMPLLSARSVMDYDGLPTERRGAWSPIPTMLVDLTACPDRRRFENARYYRSAFRRNCGSPKTNERSLRAAIIPPGLVASENLYVARHVSSHPTWRELAWTAVANSFAVDGLLRPKVQTKIGLALLQDTQSPGRDALPWRFLVHSALRLTCSSVDYARLWQRELGEWREQSPSHTWPVLADDSARWAVRAAIDAVVADAYGLDRAQYEHILSSFSHKSYPEAPTLCLAAFDELKQLGLEPFCKKHDPYWDIPLVETLPEPVIDLPLGDPTDAAGAPKSKRTTKPSTAQTEMFFGQADPTEASLAPASNGAPELDEAAYAKLCRTLEDRGELTSATAQALLGTDATGARPYLNRLIEEGLAAKYGKARGTKYVHLL